MSTKEQKVAGYRWIIGILVTLAILAGGGYLGLTLKAQADANAQNEEKHSDLEKTDKSMQAQIDNLATLSTVMIALQVRMAVKAGIPSKEIEILMNQIPKQK